MGACSAVDWGGRERKLWVTGGRVWEVIRVMFTCVARNLVCLAS